MAPRHDPPQGRVRDLFARALGLRNRRRRPGKPGEPGGESCPVEPNRPLDLSGGAAAALEFDA
ncbi:MAG: hypothetical protein PGN08_03190 [Sphingomonas taxi]